MNRTEYFALARRVEALESNGAERHAPEPQILALQAAIRSLGERMEEVEVALTQARDWAVAAKSDAVQGHGFAKGAVEGVIRRLEAIEASLSADGLDLHGLDERLAWIETELKRRRGGRPRKADSA